MAKKIRLMAQIEHWRDCARGALLIDYLPGAYDDSSDGLVEQFRAGVEDHLALANFDIVHVYQQSRGVGVVVQSPDEGDEYAFDVAGLEVADQMKDVVDRYVVEQLLEAVADGREEDAEEIRRARDQIAKMRQVYGAAD